MRVTRRPWPTRSSRPPSRSRRSVAPVDLVDRRFVADKGYHSNRDDGRVCDFIGRAQLRLGAGFVYGAFATGRVCARHCGAGRGVCQPCRRIRGCARETAAAAAGRATGTAQRRDALRDRPRCSTRPSARASQHLSKRLLVQVCGVDLGLLMRHLTGVGTPSAMPPGPCAAALLNRADRPPVQDGGAGGVKRRFVAHPRAPWSRPDLRRGMVRFDTPIRTT